MSTCATETLTLPGGTRAKALAPGALIGGNLRIVARIGSGGMGAVYLATDTGPLGRSCAVKILDNAAAGSAGHARFLSEARIMASLRHPNIVPVSRFGTDAATGLDYYVMDEFLPSREETERICAEVLRCPCPSQAGGLAPLTLSRILDGGKALPEETVVSVALQVLSAMEAAHALSPPVVHRDIKPSNILFASDGRALLADFGIAKRIPEGHEGIDANELTAPNATPGTWAYSAPEQRRGGEIGKETDYYSFGLVLFRMLTGGMPSATAALPTDIAPKVSREWGRLFAALLREDQASRLSDAAAVRGALLKIAAGVSLRVRRRRMARIAARAALAAAVAFAAFAGIWAGLRALRPASEPPEDPRQHDEGNASGQDEGVAAEPQGEGAAAEPFDSRGWATQMLGTLRKWIDSAMTTVVPDADGRIKVGKGELLFLGDVPGVGTVEAAPTILLDGGTLLVAPPLEALRNAARRCEEFIETASADAPVPQLFDDCDVGVMAWHGKRKPSFRTAFVHCAIELGPGGGRIDKADAGEPDYVAFLSPIECAKGVGEATLDVFGFSGIVIGKPCIGEGVKVTGCGSVCDAVSVDGNFIGRRWFDPDDPL